MISGLTVNSKSDGFLRAGVEISILGQTGVVACLHTKDPGDGELWSSVDLRVVIKPYILAGRVRGCLTRERDVSIFQSCISKICY